MKWSRLAIFNKVMLRFAELRGEWWIIDGRAEFADGDVGDLNHEVHVIEHVRSQYAPDEDRDIIGGIDWEGFEQQLFEQALREQSLDKNEIYDPEPYVLPKLKELGMSNEEILIARAQGALIDIRAFAMKNYGWKSVKENYISTWTLAAADLKSIANGLWDADSEISEEEAFTIEVYVNHKVYSDVPLSVIGLENPNELLRY